MMQQSLATVLFPGYRRRVLGLLYLRIDEAFHGREIARRTNLPPGTVTRELNKLAEVGLLVREARGNQVVYRANRACPVFAEIAGIVRKTSGLADELRRVMAPLVNKVQVAFIFGSMAGGTQVSGSDVDILVIGDVEFGRVIDAFYEAQQSLQREINPKLFSAREWSTKLKTKDSFATHVLENPKIFLIGDEQELTKVSKLKTRKHLTHRQDHYTPARKRRTAHRRLQNSSRQR